MQDQKNRSNPDYDFDNVGPPVPMIRHARDVSQHRDQPMGDGYTPEERALVKDIIAKLKRHAQEQQLRADEIRM